DDAALLVLGDRPRAGVEHLLEAARSVVAHPGHDHAERVRAGRARDRAEEYVDRRAMARDERSVDDLGQVLRAAALDQHVLAARGDQGASRQDAVAIRRLLDLDLA